MTYEESWKEHKRWLQNGINYLIERRQVASGEERQRIIAKLDGLNVAYQHMTESENMYNLK